MYSTRDYFYWKITQRNGFLFLFKMLKFVKEFPKYFNILSRSICGGYGFRNHTNPKNDAAEGIVNS